MKMRGFWSVKLVDTLGLILFVTAEFAIAAMAFLIAADVVMRYAFHRPWGWVFDLGGFVMASVLFLGLAHVLRQDRHIRVEVFTRKLSERKIACLELVTSILASAALIVVIWNGWEWALRALRMGLVSSGYPPLPLFPAMVIVPIGGAACVLQLLIRIVRNLQVIRHRTQ